MNQTAQNTLNALKRPLYFLASTLMLFAGTSGIVYASAAGGQVQYRSFKIGNTGVKGGTITGGLGVGTGVTYRVTFRAATSYTIKGVVLDFCAGTGGTPFIGDSNCPDPTSFTMGTTPTVNTADYVVNSSTTAGLGSGWSAASSTGQTLTLTNSTGTALTSGTDYTFAISGITNPSVNETFYSRLITYTSDTGDIASYTHSTPGNYQDYGGFALSTANIVQVTAKVQETLSYCVVGVVMPGATVPTSCTDTGITAPAITLGHGTNNTLDPGAVDTNSVFSFTSTNALHGATIRMHNSNACGGLSTDNGTTCAIPAASSGSSSPAAIVAGTAAFGMYCNDSSGGSGDNITCDGNYNDGTATHYGMDTQSIDDNVTTTFGDIVAQSTAPMNARMNKYDFAATASNTTPAGIYTANLAMIATGTF